MDMSGTTMAALLLYNTPNTLLNISLLLILGLAALQGEYYMALQYYHLKQPRLLDPKV